MFEMTSVFEWSQMSAGVVIVVYVITESQIEDSEIHRR